VAAATGYQISTAIPFVADHVNASYILTWLKRRNKTSVHRSRSEHKGEFIITGMV
jgi:hypothetical protein